MINNGSESRKELLDTVLDYSFDQEKGDPCGHARMGPHTSRATELGIEQIGVKRSRLDEGPDSDRQRDHRKMCVLQSQSKDAAGQDCG